MFLFLFLIEQVYCHFILDSPVEQIVWCGSDSFLLSARGTLYKNNVNETSKLISLSNRNNITIMEILQSKADSQVLYIIGDEDISFNTKNCGKSYTLIQHVKGLFDFRLNSLEPNSLLAFKEIRCQKDDPLCKDKYRKQLFVSNDYGESFNKILNRVRDANWDKLIALDEIPDERIVASHLHDNSSVLVSYSDDLYKTFRPLRWHSYGYYQTNEYLFVLIDPDSLSKGYDLEVTKAGKLSLTEVILPIDDKSKYSFTVLDTIRGSIFLSVTHHEELPKITNIYQSNQEGTEYSLSLLNNVRSMDTGNCDFEPIIDGVYIANIYENTEFEKIKMRRTTKNMEALKRLENYKQTRITYDRGGEWHQLKSPRYNFKGQALNCNGDCSLHLLGRSEAPRNRIISNSHIVIGTGNTGLYLGNEFNTYLSRDSGHTWFEILEGMYVYEIADNTGVIMFINDHEQANEILYTWDDGYTFQKTSMNVSMDITSVAYKNNTFLIHGIQDAKTLGVRDDITSTSLRGIVVALDINSIKPRTCERFDEPGIPDSDYEYWYPTNGEGERCIFGKKIQYIRRKRNANCYNPHDDLPIKEEPCPCTAEDWECDVGYQRDLMTNKCVPFKQIKKPLCRGTYMKSQGYRKIPGDDCEGGIYLGQIEVQCDEEEQITETENIKINTKQVKDENQVPITNRKINQEDEMKATVNPTQKYNKTFNESQEQVKQKGGIKFQYLIFGGLFLALSMWLKRKYIDRPKKKPQKLNRSGYFPGGSAQEKQSLFADI